MKKLLTFQYDDGRHAAAHTSVGDQRPVEAIVYPNERQLMDLYCSNVALVYPSLHEGFGIPPLGAMACRTLAITSNTTSLPKVMGNGGIMLDPTREADWIDCLSKTAAQGAVSGTS